MKNYLTTISVAVAALCGMGVWMQSQTLQYGDFSWTHIGLSPFSSKSVHVLKYGDETLCSRVLDEGESPWVRANADRTLSVSCGRVGSETTVHYSIDKKDYVDAPRADLYGFDMNFDALAQGEGDSAFGQEVRHFSHRVDTWARRH